MTYRDRMERQFEVLADSILRYPRTVVAACATAMSLLAIGLPQLTIETSFASYLPEGNEQQEIYRDFRERFGSGERVVILLRPDEIFDLAFLEDLRRLHDALEDGLPYLRDITSLINARQLEDVDDSLISTGFLDEWPQTEADLAAAQTRVLSQPLYTNTIISEDGSATAIVIELEGALGSEDDHAASNASGSDRDDALLGFDDSGESDPKEAEFGALLTTDQSAHLVRALDAILAEAEPTSAEIYVAGTPILAHRLGEMLTRDIVQFVSLSMLFTALLLYLLFRNVWAMIHPLLVVVFSVIGTLGWMGLAGIPLTAVTEILPSLIVAIGVGDAVHIQAMFYKRLNAGDTPPTSIRWAMGHSGLAVLLTSVTTAASMAAFRVADLQPIIDLGRTAPVGVGLALLFSVTLLPALLSITPMQPRGSGRRNAEAADSIDRILLALGRQGTRRPRLVICAVALLWTAAILGGRFLYFSQDDLRWLPEHDPVRVAAEQLNESMKGAEPLDLLVEFDGESDLRDPQFVAALLDLKRRSMALSVGEVQVGQTLSVADLIEETHRVLTEGSPDALVLPNSRELISQELLLFESAAPEDLEDLAEGDYRTTRVMLTVPFVDALHYPQFAREVERLARETVNDIAPESSVRFTATGLLMLAGETFELLFGSMLRSYGVAFVAITILMLALIADLRLGLLSILPNLTPIILVLGIMGWTGSPLDVSSMLVGGILIGVVVDDTIHFIHNFARYRRQLGCSLRAIRETLVTAGRAMLVTSTVLSIGFFVFTGAWLQNVSDFGLLCGIGAILAFLADVVFLPAIVALVVPCGPNCKCKP